MDRFMAWGFSPEDAVVLGQMFSYAHGTVTRVAMGPGLNVDWKLRKTRERVEQALEAACLGEYEAVTAYGIKYLKTDPAVSSMGMIRLRLRDIVEQAWRMGLVDRG